MIPLTDISWQSQPWTWHLANAITDINTLVSALDIAMPESLVDRAPSFPLMAPLPFVARIRRGDPDDPLLRQLLPTHRERQSTPGYSRDPLGELDKQTPRGLLHKYHGRVLIVATGKCAINCRYCFRRHFPYEDEQPDGTAWAEIIGYIRNDASISEVILSGGDPFVLSDRRLAWIASQLESIAHVSTLRIHTRLPIMIPGRVCDELVDWIVDTRLHVVVVLHTNHAQEISSEVVDALSALSNADATLLNQSVLLRGVNDSADTLIRLSHCLFEAGVLPYYLHLLDPVDGAAHFDVPESEAQALMRDVTNALPGYLVPRLVKEIPGEAAKAQRSWSEQADML